LNDRSICHRYLDLHDIPSRRYSVRLDTRQVTRPCCLVVFVRYLILERILHLSNDLRAQTNVHRFIINYQANNKRDYMRPRFGLQVSDASREEQVSQRRRGTDVLDAKRIITDAAYD
jgi:hypothetical protein